MKERLPRKQKKKIKALWRGIDRFWADTGWKHYKGYCVSNFPFNLAMKRLTPKNLTNLK